MGLTRHLTVKVFGYFMTKFVIRSAAFLCLVLVSASFISANENERNTATRASQPYRVSVTSWGPTQADVDAAKRRVENSGAVQSKLRGSKYRLVSFEYLNVGEESKSGPSQPPTRFRIVFYNYSNDTAILAESDFAGREPVAVTDGAFDPGVNGDEIKEAYDLIRLDPQFAPMAAAKTLELYESMPGVSNLNGVRLVNVGVSNPATGENYIVGISFKDNKVIRYENNAPPTSRAAPEACGIPSAGQGSTSSGVAGQYQMTVGGTERDSSPIWEMLVIRPSSSSGNSSERSGIEIRDVKYKGKSVLKRGHAPVLNVQYVNNVCGPYRDWQYSEGFFAVPSTGVTYPNGPTGGIAVLGAGQVATTSVETRTDSGNFQGVAIYQQDTGQGNELVLVTEMNAGWYRYIMEWRFGPNGVIRPRYGFGSTTSSCVCAPRNHHVYWRLDFDVVSPTNKLFQVERGRKFLKPVTTEASIFRNYATNRGFVIQNSTSDEAYAISPGSNDGSVTGPRGTLTDTYGAGDFWLMRFKGTAGAPTEIDDPNTNSAANLAPWINNESLENQDLVIWYSAHQYRVDDASRPSPERPDVISGVHVIGPEIRPIRW